MAKLFNQLVLAALLLLTACQGQGGSGSCAIDPSATARGIYKGTSSLPYDASAAKRILVGVGGNKANVCTGTALSARVVLTAAHCFYGVTNPGVVVVQEVNGGVKNYSVEQFTVHPDSYHPPAGTNLEDIGKQSIDPGVDIALVITKSEMPAPYAKVVPEVPTGGETLHILGFGDTSSGGGLPNKILMAAAVFNKFYDMEVTAPGGGKSVAKSSVIETRPTASGAIACQGDSGGPLVVASKGMQGFIGVTSGVNAYGCGEASTVQFTRVSSFAAWITSTGGTYLSSYLMNGACK